MKTYQEIVGDGGSDVVGQIAEQMNRLKSRMASIRYLVVVMSGKGGVGKSTVTVNLATTLALQNFSVGILDADINGPSIARMTGLKRSRLPQGPTSILPAESLLNMKVMSIDLFLPEDHTPVLWNSPTRRDAYTWRGMIEMAAIKEFLTDTEWGELDFLFIDLPPGTDKLPDMVDLLPRLSGTIIITIPSRLSQFVVSKSIKMARSVLKTPVIGLVENMADYVCQHCGKTEALSPPGKWRS